MNVDDYLQLLNDRKKISDVKEKIIRRLWGNESDSFPKPWVSSAELLELTGQKYFDRRTRELRDQLGCDIESTYLEAFSGHAWRIHSAELADAQAREFHLCHLWRAYPTRCQRFASRSQSTALAWWRQ